MLILLCSYPGISTQRSLGIESIPAVFDIGSIVSSTIVSVRGGPSSLSQSRKSNPISNMVTRSTPSQATGASSIRISRNGLSGEEVLESEVVFLMPNKLGDPEDQLATTFLTVLNTNAPNRIAATIEMMATIIVVRFQVLTDLLRTLSGSIPFSSFKLWQFQENVRIISRVSFHRCESLPNL